MKPRGTSRGKTSSLSRRAGQVAVHGAVLTASTAWYGLGAVLDVMRNWRYVDAKLGALQRRLGVQAAAHQRLEGAHDDRWWAPDTACVGGTVLVDCLTGVERVPEDVERAYALAYPRLAESHSFREAAARVSEDYERLAGLISGVRGKLFEIQYVDHLNAGNLPPGLHAELATSATQAGWDIAILDGRGNTVEVLQAKATESVGYVKQALAENPQIDVVTTDEVYQHLARAGGGDGVIGSGIPNEGLAAHLADHVSGDEYSPLEGVIPDLLPGIPVTTVGLAAFTSYRDLSLTPLGRSVSVGDRVGRAVPSYLIATLVAGVTSGPLGLVLVTASAVGIACLARRGRKRGLELRALRERVKRDDRILRSTRHPDQARKRWGRHPRELSDQASRRPAAPLR